MKTPDERMEALTQTVELLAQMHVQNKRNFNERFEKLEGQITRIVDQVSRIVGVTETLAQVAQAHENRIHRLEGN